MSAMSDRAARANSRGDMHRLGWLLLGDAGFERRLPVYLDAIGVLPGKGDSDCHQLLILLWDRSRGLRSLIVCRGWFHIASDGNNPAAANVS